MGNPTLHYQRKSLIDDSTVAKDKFQNSQNRHLSHLVSYFWYFLFLFFLYSVSFCAVKLAGISSLPLLTLSCHSFGTSKTFFKSIYFVIIYKLFLNVIRNIPTTGAMK